MSGQRGEVVCTITSAKVCSVSVCLPGTFGLHVYWEFVTDKFLLIHLTFLGYFISVVSKLVSSKNFFRPPHVLNGGGFVTSRFSLGSWVRT